MKAVIMAGGEGTRLRPLTAQQPKPMIPIANRPMMEHIIGLLKQHGFDEIVVTVAFLANVIRQYFGDGSEFGVRMVYANEDTPLGTAGSVRNARDVLDERFLVISGDVLTDIDLGRLWAQHEEKAALATLALCSMENPLEFGIVITKPDGEVERFLEKPSWGEVFSDTVNTGIYVLEPEIFDYIGEGQVDFSSDVFPRLLAEKKPMYGVIVDGYWEDVGTLDAYLRAHHDVLDGKVNLSIPGFRLGDGIWLGEGAEVDPDARVDAPVVIGDYARIEAGAHLREYSVVGANVRIGRDAYMQRSVVHDNAYIGAQVRLRGTVVGRAADLRRGVRCDEGVVIGDQVHIGEDAVLNQAVKVYPHKTVESGAVVSSSIVWETKAARTLFEPQGIRGLANVDLGPELATRVAMAYGTTLKKGSRVVLSRDTSRVSRALKRALTAGLNAVGIDVDDLEVATVPLTQFLIRTGRAQGGISVRLAVDDPEQVLIRMFSADGTDLDEVARRKVERLLGREELRRVSASEIGDISYPPRALEFYTSALESSVDAQAIRDHGFKVVLDYASGSSAVVMPNVLAKMGAEVLAVNPYASTVGALSFDREAQAAHVGNLVRAAGAHLGAVIDPDGERLTLVDDQGQRLDDTSALLVLASLLPSESTPGDIVVPVSVTRAIEGTVAPRGVRRTRLALSAQLSAIADGGVVFGGDGAGRYAVPAFQPAFDAVAAIVHVLNALSATNSTLSKLAQEAPRTFVVSDVVDTPWDQKGQLMRMLVEKRPEGELELIDGVKVIRPEGWTLVVPDPVAPRTLVWAEGASAAEATSLLHDTVRKVRQSLR